MNRLLILFLVVISFGCTTNESVPFPTDGSERYYNADLKPFYHGVASGDPDTTSVTIWTRVTPPEVQTVTGSWVVAADEAMQDTVLVGDFSTDSLSDYTVKLRVQSLKPNNYYYYQFTALDAQSVVGRTKTLPTGNVDQLRFGIVSCTNFEAGYFNGLGTLATYDSIDAVIHLGDYIYEYAQGRYGDTTLGRFHFPNKEIVELADYRTRYAVYRLDADFQKAHQMHPFITIWDDHEITNNSYQTGAQNHQPEEEGNYGKRKKVARQAYYEWLPIQDQANQQLYRSFTFGDLAQLVMLDERLAGRSKQVDSITQADYTSAERSMLGADQLHWFKEQLANADATWKIIGNQVLFSDFDLSPVSKNRTRNLDAWDGYPAEKQNIIQFLKEGNIKNTIFITGDTHRSWAFEVPESIEAYQADPNSAVAIELGTTSITSSNTDESTSVDTAMMIEQMLMDPLANPHLKFTNQRDHGFILLTLTKDQADAQWIYSKTIKTDDNASAVGFEAMVPEGEAKIFVRK